MVPVFQTLFLAILAWLPPPDAREAPAPGRGDVVTTAMSSRAFEPGAVVHALPPLVEEAGTLHEDDDDEENRSIRLRFVRPDTRFLPESAGDGRDGVLPYPSFHSVSFPLFLLHGRLSC